MTKGAHGRKAVGSLLYAYFYPIRQASREKGLSVLELSFLMEMNYRYYNLLLIILSLKMYYGRIINISIELS
jgi:hypothetical protein